MWSQSNALLNTVRQHDAACGIKMASAEEMVESGSLIGEHPQETSRMDTRRSLAQEPAG